MAELTKDLVRAWLRTIEPRKEFHLKTVMDGDIDFDKYSNLYGSLRRMFTEFVKARVIKPAGRRDGYYMVIEPVEPIRSLEGNKQEALDFAFPIDHELNSSFGFEDLIEVFPGDLILITGPSNYGKTAVALNILGENVDKMESVLMGSEYTAVDNKITPRFRRRMAKMKWVDWYNSDGDLKFELLPVDQDFEDYIKTDKLNVIDWITLPDKYYMIDYVLHKMKNWVGNGVLVAVLQKNRNSEYAEGGERTERYADVYLKLNPYGENQTRLEVGKVKSSKGQVIGRSWVFRVVDYGANIHDIREVKKCPKCYNRDQKRPWCDGCNRLGWVEKLEDMPF